MRLRPSRIIAIVALSAVGASCHRASSSDSSATSQKTARALRLAPLLEFEESARRARRAAPVPDDVLGPDPYRVIAHGESYMGLLRGSEELVLFDRQLHESAHVKGPPGASGLVSTTSGVVLASGELGNQIVAYRATQHELTQVATIPLGDVRGVRALAWGANRVFALDTRNDRVVSFRLGDDHGARDERRFATCRGAIDVAATDEALRVTCLFDHALALYPLDVGGMPGKEARIVHDGPIWSSDLAKLGDEFLVAIGGVEDHALDRSIGSFGNVDSFVFLYRWRPGEMPTRLASVNVSEHGVVTPKLVHIRTTEPAVEVDVIGYGGERRATLAFSRGTGSPPLVRTATFPPGSAGAAYTDNGVLVANPLLDAWITVNGERYQVHAVSRGPSDRRARLGEALFFTELMAKKPTSEGPKSRFTCETCHLEGGIDGRTHHTGRGNVRATTKPLFGLLENRPYFSRAFDPTLTKMVDNEFRVANAGGEEDPWFTLEVADHPFLKHLGVTEEHIDGVELRRSLMHFLASFPHRPNPATVGRSTFEPAEAKGASVFLARCERCHAARRFSDEPDSHVDFEHWEERVFAGDLVWASSDYQKTGIEPYVAEQGARVPSLRRVVRKRPYFTNGSSRTLEDVLERFRESGRDAWHDPKHAPAGAQQLSSDERAALLAFLELL